MGSAGSDAGTLQVRRWVRLTSGSGRNSQHGQLHHCRCPSTSEETTCTGSSTTTRISSRDEGRSNSEEHYSSFIASNCCCSWSYRTGKSTVFPLAIAHWTKQVEGLAEGLTLCAQPRRILAQQLCERVKSNRKMRYNDRTVGYMIARESSRDTSTKLLYCTEAIVALDDADISCVNSTPFTPRSDHHCGH